MRRSILAAMAAFAARSVFANPPVAVQAGDSMPKTVRFIAPVGPGDGGDRATRYVAERFAQISGLSTVTENRPGADMIIAVQSMLNAPPDGGTILYLSPTAVIINPLLRNDLPYDAQRDIRAVAAAYRSPMLIVTGVDSPFRTLDDLMAASRSQPGQVAVAHATQAYRIAALLLAHQAGVTFNMVPYRLSSQAVNDLIGGALAASFVGPAVGVQLLRSGKVRVLASTGATRFPLLPEVPTVAESGFPRFHFYIWIGFGVHGKTPEPIVQRIEDTLLQLLRHPDFTRFTSQEFGNEVTVGTGSFFAQMIAAETERYREVLRALR